MTSPAPAAPAASALFADLFDDAGLFPPASLSMDEAFTAHRTARQGAFRWMLARFVVPLSRLAELAEVAPRYGNALRLALVVDREANEDDVAIVDEHGWRVETLEQRLPDDDVERAATSLRHAAAAFDASSGHLEVPWSEFPLDALTRAASTARDAAIGLKLRCGGDTAASIPAPAVVAAFLVACASTGVQLKVTAGLHHPFRHPDAAVDAMQHGFVNVLAAATFAHCGGRDEAAIAEVVADADTAAFVIDDRSLSWHGRAVSADEIASARRALLVAIGSCSFREPVDDLVALGLLPAQ